MNELDERLDFKLTPTAAKIYWNYIERRDVEHQMSAINEALHFNDITCIASHYMPWSEAYETVVKLLQQFRNNKFIRGIAWGDDFKFSDSELATDLSKTVLLLDDTVNYAQANSLVSQLISIQQEQTVIVIRLIKDKE